MVVRVRRIGRMGNGPGKWRVEAGGKWVEAGRWRREVCSWLEAYRSACSQVVWPVAV